jgi:hypothetical protein
VIDADTVMLTEHVPASPVGRRRHGDVVVVWVGASRLTGRVIYVDRVHDWSVVWVRVPMIIVPLPPSLT